MDKKQINKKYLCILKILPDTNLVKMDYLILENPHKEEFEELYKFLEDKKTTPKKIYNYINQNEILKNVLFRDYNYCKNLYGTYQGLYETEKEIKDRYFDEPFYISGDHLSSCKGYTKDRINAFELELAYKKCIDDPNIIAYSHRRIGWSNPTFTFNSNFKVEIKTNFGYGMSSYFYLKVVYKGIEIVPFRDWVIYERAQLIQIIHYTKVLTLGNESWEEGMLFLQAASNLALKNEIEFVNKYIIDEIATMINNLEDFLKKEKFIFNNYKKIQGEVNKVGFELTEFRGFKITGALKFIEKILQFKDICQVDIFISKIESLNIQIQPILAKEIGLIDAEIIKFELEEKEFKRKIEELQKENDKYEKIKEKIFIEIKENNKEKGLETIKFIAWNTFNNENRIEYANFNKEFNQLKKDFDNFMKNLNSLKITKENIITYLGDINDYFEKTKNNVTLKI